MPQVELPAAVEGADGAIIRQRTSRFEPQRSSSSSRPQVADGPAHVPRPRIPSSAGPVIHVGPRRQSVALPNIGDVLWVAGHIHNRQDAKAGRYSVVVSVPKTINGRITIVTRTTWLGRPGVPSPTGTLLRFSEPGVWGHVRTVEAHLWVPPDVGRKRGQLDHATLDAVLKYFRIAGYQK